MSPSISVVIPAYNAEAYIGETVRSVLSQTAPACEVIVVDDGSTDGTAREVAALGGDVRLLSVQNGGVSAARNRGIDQAIGEWVAFVDADDQWTPEKLEVFAQAASARPEAVLLFSDFETFGLAAGVHRLEEAFSTWRSSGGLLVPDVCLLPSAAMVRRDLPVRFPEWAGNDCEDSIYFNAVAERGGVVHIPRPLTRYRRHETSAQQQIGSRDRGCENLLREYGASPEHRLRLFRSLRQIARLRRQSRQWDEFSYYCRFLSENFPERRLQVAPLLLAKRGRPVFELRDRLSGWLRGGNE